MPDSALPSQPTPPSVAFGDRFVGTGCDPFVIAELSANHGGSKEGEELVKDPQCGAYFPRSEGVSLVVDGETRHFCSPACRDKFLQKK